MTITKNDFFTSNNFKTLQDISKKYPEWKDFCLEIVNQFDDKFGTTMYSETSGEAIGEIKQLWFTDYTIAERLQLLSLSELKKMQKDKLYLYKVHSDKVTNSYTKVTSTELYNTGVNIDEPIKYIIREKEVINGVECDVIELKSFPYNYTAGDTLLSLDTILKNDDNTERADYNGALYEVVEASGVILYLRTKDKIKTPLKDTQALYIYNKAK